LYPAWVDEGDSAREAIAMNPYDGPENADFGPDQDFDADMITMNPPRWQRWRHGRPIAVAGVAIAALAGGAGVGFAATHSVAKSGAPDTAAVAAAAAASPSPSPVPAKPGGRGWRTFAGGFPGAGPAFAFGAVGGIVHGQLTVPKSGGGYQTVDVQRGTVTEVSSASITVKSADGFTASYTVSSKTLVDAEAAGIGSVKKGDSVFVTATVSGSTATAANLLDITAVKAGRASFGFPGRPANLPGAPAKVQVPSA
jgi:hypothetical protein